MSLDLGSSGGGEAGGAEEGLLPGLVLNGAVAWGPTLLAVVSFPVRERGCLEEAIHPDVF